MSKLSQYCDGLMEACWLGAVVCVPLFFSRYSDPGFELEKVVWWRSLAWLALAAWLVKAADTSTGRPAGTTSTLMALLKAPLAFAVGLFFIVNLVSGSLSFFPRYSFWGTDYGRQGIYTLGCSLTMLAVVAVHLRRMEQIQRLVTTALLASLPISLYAILQRSGYDPITYVYALGSLGRRVSSTVGNPDFLAAYLVLVFPLALWRIHSLIRMLRTAEAPDFLKALLAFYGLLAMAHVTALVCTEARGPALGLLGSVGVWFILLALHRSRRILILVPLLFGVVAAGFLLLLNLPNGPLSALRNLALLQRASSLSSQSEDAAGRGLVWRAAPQLLFATEPLPDARGGKDWFHSLRPFIGFGPCTLGGLLTRHYGWQEPGPRLEYNAHNLVWDLWTTLGTIGLAVFLFVFIGLFYHAYRQCGWVGSGRENTAFCLTVLGISVGCVAALVAWRGVPFAGVGLQLGVVAGLALYPVVCAWVFAAPPVKSAPETRATLQMALLAALAGHMIETAFSYQVTVTSALFWLYPGVLLAVLAIPDSAWGPTEPSIKAAKPGAQAGAAGRNKSFRQPPPATANHQPALVAAVLAALIVVALVHNFVHPSTNGPHSVGGILSQSFGQSGAGDHSLTACFLLLIWAAACFGLTTDRCFSHARAQWAGQFWLALMLSGGLVLLYTLLKAWQVSPLDLWTEPATAEVDLLRTAIGRDQIYLTYMGLGLSLTLLLAWACAWPTTKTAVPFTKWGLATGLALLLPTLMVVWRPNLNLARANIAFKWAEKATEGKSWPAAAAVYARAIELGPRILEFRTRLAQSLREEAEAASSDDSYNQRMAEAEKVLLAAEGLSFPDRSHRHLGDLYLTWAARQKQPDQKLLRARQASEAFDRALLIEPRNWYFWTQSGVVDLWLLLREEEGLKKFRKAIALAPGEVRPHELLGDFFAQRGQGAQDDDARRRCYLLAIEDYRQAALLCSAQGISPFLCNMNAGRLCLQVSNVVEALNCFQAAARTAPSNSLWAAEEMLARAHQRRGNKAEALDHLRAAINQAPNSERARLQQFLNEANSL